MIDEKPKWQPFEEPLEPGELTHRVNEQLAALWASQRIEPVGPASDAEFMRRVYLDLPGRVPSVSEAREFLSDPSPDRREALVDRLLGASRSCDAFGGGVAADSVAGRRRFEPARRVGASSRNGWPRGSRRTCRTTRSCASCCWPRGACRESGPLLFYAALRLNPEELAARTSRAFLGVRMECAQCHDHPFDESFAAGFLELRGVLRPHLAAARQDGDDVAGARGARQPAGRRDDSRVG